MADDERTLSREEQREYLRRRVIAPDSLSMNPAYIRRQRARRSEIFRDVLFAVTICALFALAAVFYFHNYSFSTYAQDYELNERTLNEAKLLPCADGCVALNRDSVSYIYENEVRYTSQAAFSDPRAAVNGQYFAVFDRGGYQVYLYDTTGPTSTIRVTRQILGIAIAASGVTAVFTESSDAAYISYFDRFGNRIPVEIRTILEATGYPVNFAVSPDGQRLAVLYCATQNGTGESRLYLYDFEKGRADDNYIIAKLDHYHESGTYLAECGFVTNDMLFAVGDNDLTFLRIDAKRNVYETHVPVEERILSVFHSAGGPGLVLSKDDGKIVRVYQPDGTLFSEFEIDFPYEQIAADDRGIVFTAGTELYYYNRSGKLRYSGFLTGEVQSVAFTGRHSLTLNTGDMIEKITLK